MNRDSALFLVIGLLAGFLAGYVLQEEMAEVQPPRRIPGAPHGETGGMAAASAAPQMPAASAEGGGATPGAPMARIQELRLRVEQNPQDAEALLELANLNFDIQNWTRAQELYERVLAIRPADPDVLTDLGICLRAQGAFEEALGRFREAQGAAPSHWQSRFNEVVVLGLDLNDSAAAEPKLEELRRLAPGNADVERLAAEIRKRGDR